MARLSTQDGRSISDLADIQTLLAPLDISIRQWPVGGDERLRALLAKPQLEDGEKDAVLAALDHYFRNLKRERGYQTRDLIVLSDAVPGLESMLSKFDRCHTHADDEIRYIIDGEGIFGFVLPDGSQVELTVSRGDYINVPRGTEHWFRLTASRRIKAIRYFSSTAGWVPEYTGRAIAFG